MVALALAGCVATPIAPAESSAAILGGEADTHDPAVVILSSRLDGSGDYVNCSGTLISPHLVLSAAHCFDPALVGPIKVTNVFLGADSKDKTQTADLASWRIGVSFTLDPLFKEVPAVHDVAVHDVAVHDIAVIVLNKPVTTATPLPLLRTPPTEKAALRLIGYGLIDAQDPGSWGTRYETSVAISGVDDTSLWSTDVVHSGCEGDSGGAGVVTVDGADLLAGVISGSLGNKNCASGSKLSRVDQSLDLIDAQLAAHDPDFAPTDMAAAPDLGAPPAALTSHTGGCSTVGDTASVTSLLLVAGALYVLRRRKWSKSAVI